MVIIVRDKIELETLINSYLDGLNFELIAHTLKCLDSKRDKKYPYTILFGVGTTRVVYDHEVESDTIRMTDHVKGITANIAEKGNQTTYYRKDQTGTFKMYLNKDEYGIYTANTVELSKNPETVQKLELK